MYALEWMMSFLCCRWCSCCLPDSIRRLMCSVLEVYYIGDCHPIIVAVVVGRVVVGFEVVVCCCVMVSINQGWWLVTAFQW